MEKKFQIDLKNKEILHTECNCEDYKDAKVQLKTYRENVNYPVRIKKWREKIKEA